MITTRYICDFCGNSQSSPDQFWEIAVTVGSRGSQYPSNKKTRDICRKCLEERSLLPIKTEGVTVTQPAPTIDDLIREIVREEVGS